MKARCLMTAVLCVFGLAAGADLHAGQPREKQTIAPDFTLKSTAQETITLSSFKGKQPVLLFFWTTWCPFCIKEFRSLNTVSADIEKGGVKLLAINAGESLADISRAVSRYAFSFPVLLDEKTEVTDRYNVVGVPTFVLIDRQGYIQSVSNDLPREKIRQLNAP